MLVDLDFVSWNEVLVAAENLHKDKVKRDSSHSRIVAGYPKDLCGFCLKSILVGKNV